MLYQEQSNRQPSQTRLNNTTVDMPDGILNISLAHKETLEKPLSFVPEVTGNDMKLRYILYRNGNPIKPYRNPDLWINMTWT
ncbi:DUF1616 domain-containing protein [Methanolobus halotolerans]|uniref:Uncharacterized protein n=1 Tax=Methanolobus halotolerans TaxID=2052935 RepID=A0A4E0PST9_9EURY|nr:DUF1616 domain-containing protein [Methanolobus halotolerans]TGC06941.1 hypothetical protein CUN85_12450 [Methanolobus halotolerans]